MQLHNNQGELLFQHALCYEPTCRALYRSALYVAEAYLDRFNANFPSAFNDMLLRHANLSQAEYWANVHGTTRASSLTTT